MTTRITGQDVRDGTLTSSDLATGVTDLLLPDPTGEPDGRWLRTNTGAAVWVAVDAGDIPFTPAGTISATDVQAAIEEVAAEASAPVSSVFTRTGAVVAAAGDYTAADVTNVPAGGIAAVTVQAALNELDTEKLASGAAAGGVLDGTYPNPGLAAAVAGDGLAETTNVLSVNVDGATLEINADALRVKASGITANEIAANAVGSSELADDAVDTNAIQANAVTAAKVAADVATQAELDAVAGADFLVGTATGVLSAEIVAGTVPAGELGGTWGAPTVDANHAGEYVGGGGDIAINDTNYVTLCSQAFTVAAGDSFIVEIDFLILNNSGGTRTYTYAIAVGAFVAEVVDGTTHAASATNRAYQTFRGCAEIRASNLAFAGARNGHMAPAAANTTASEVLIQDRYVWNTSTSDFTGAQTVAMKIKSSATNATQTATVLGFRIRRV